MPLSTSHPYLILHLLLLLDVEAVDPLGERHLDVVAVAVVHLRVGPLLTPVQQIGFLQLGNFHPFAISTN